MSSEFELIARLAPYLAPPSAAVPVAAGDDAAVLRAPELGLCVAVDVLVQDVHFRTDLSTFPDVGWKAVAVNVSDLAAMAAKPVAAVVGLARPPGLQQRDVEALYEGMDEACRRWKLHLVGGDLVHAPVLMIAVTVLGDVAPDAAVRREGARPGDRVVVAGTLGAAGAALALARAGRPPDSALLEAHRRPRALVAAGQALAEHGATAMIDVSDGLGADLRHIAQASNVAIRLAADALPIAAGTAHAARTLGFDPFLFAAGAGEDFALAATVPPQRASEAARAAGAAEGVAAAVVGEVVAAGPLVTLGFPDGTSRDISHLGWDHFKIGQACPSREP